MCNLYSMTKSREALTAYVRAMRDRTGNQPPLPAIFPDQLAPVVRTARDGVREVATMRWGFPPAGGGKRPVTNIRNLNSGYWRGWLEQPRFLAVDPPKDEIGGQRDDRKQGENDVHDEGRETTGSDGGMKPSDRKNGPVSGVTSAFRKPSDWLRASGACGRCPARW